MTTIKRKPPASDVYQWQPTFATHPVASERLVSLLHLAKSEDDRPNLVKMLRRKRVEQEMQFPPSAICSACMRVITGPRQDSGTFGPFRYPLHQSFTQQRASAAEGCRFCWMRHLYVANTNDLANLSPSETTQFGYVQNSFGKGLGFEYAQAKKQVWPSEATFYLNETVKGSAWSVLFHLRREECGVQWPTAGLQRTVACRNDSPSSLECIKLWLDDCNQKHKECRRQRHEAIGWLPTRLIDLGQGQTMQPVLRSSRELPRNTRYMALSHYWGSAQFLQLKKGNVDALSKRIPINRLSRTFREAMEVVKALGVQYIWIDSLCIVQDSHDDWKWESSRMSSVYRSSYCTIAASAARDGSEGLFRSRMLFDVEPCILATNWSGQPHTTYVCDEMNGWDAMTQASPLMSRAWVVQEMVLSSRILHFAETQMFWECSDRRACEMHPEQVPQRYSTKLKIDEWKTKPLEHRYWLWNRVVERYSGAALTYPHKDKLMALAGVAASLQLPSQEYLAGLWSCSLETQLLWERRTTARSHGTGVGEHTYVAPSWSWASIDAPVTMRVWHENPNSEAGELLARVKDARSDLVDEALPYGAVQGGFIQLQCVITRTAYRKGQNFLEYVILDQNRAVTEGEELYCLPIYRADSEYGWIVFGLIIEPTADQAGSYIRRGHFSTEPGFRSEQELRISCHKWHNQNRNS